MFQSSQQALLQNYWNVAPNAIIATKIPMYKNIFIFANGLSSLFVQTSSGAHPAS
jgi:hypothetical protein